jgi:MFS family permease
LIFNPLPRDFHRGFYFQKAVMESHPELAKNLKHNFIVNVLDGTFFGLGFGFSSFATVLPLFVSNLTDSATLIGLIPAVHNVGWMLPQLLTAKSVSRMKRFKPAVVFWTIQERWPFFGLALIAALMGWLTKPVALALTFGLLVLQGLGAGMTANPWQNMIGKIIPSTMRGTFFGIQSGAANLLGGGGAIAAGFILEKMDFPDGFGLVFLICGLSMTLSFFFIAQTREPERMVEPPPSAQISFWGNVTKILKQDRSFRWFIISRFVFQFGTMASAFYAVYAVKHLGMGDVAAGAMTSLLFIVQVGSNTVFGWLGDKVGHMPVLRLGAVCAVIAAVLAFTAPSAGWFFAVMVFAGVANSVFWTIGMVLTLEFGSLTERPTYIGLANTLIAPAAVLAPLLGGWVADTFSFKHTFALAAIFALVSLAVLVRFVRREKIKY